MIIPTIIRPQALIIPIANLIRKSALTNYLVVTFILNIWTGLGTASPGVYGCIDNPIIKFSVWPLI